MPVYQFTCERGHQTEWLGKHDARPAEVECHECGNEAMFGSSWRTVKVRSRTSDATERTQVWREITCSHCGFEDIDEFPRDQSTVPCEKCDNPADLGILGSITRYEERRYGQMGAYDRGLGCWVMSEKHRREICAREGLTPVDDVGDDYLIEVRASAKREEDRKCAEHDDYMDRLENSPEFAKHRELKDRGYHEDLFPEIDFRNY